MRTSALTVDEVCKLWEILEQRKMSLAVLFLLVLQ